MKKNLIFAVSEEEHLQFKTIALMKKTTMSDILYQYMKRVIKKEQESRVLKNGNTNKISYRRNQKRQ